MGSAAAGCDFVIRDASQAVHHQIAADSPSATPGCGCRIVKVLYTEFEPTLHDG